MPGTRCQGKGQVPIMSEEMVDSIKSMQLSLAKMNDSIINLSGEVARMRNETCRDSRRNQNYKDKNRCYW